MRNAPIAAMKYSCSCDKNCTANCYEMVADPLDGAQYFALTVQYMHLLTQVRPIEALNIINALSQNYTWL